MIDEGGGGGLKKNAAREKELDEKWNSRRKRNLILKGLDKPTQENVIRALVQHGLTTEKEIVRVVIREVRDVKYKEWAFVWMVSEQAVEASFSKRFYLKGTSLYLQRDRSKEERRRLKEQRLKRAVPERRQAQHQPWLTPHPAVGGGPGQQSGRQQPLSIASYQPAWPPNDQQTRALWNQQSLDHSSGHSQFPESQDPNGSSAPPQDFELEFRTSI